MKTMFEIPETYATKIFLNANNGISISQFSGSDTDDLIVISTKKQARDIISAIRELLKSASFEPEDDEQ